MIRVNLRQLCLDLLDGSDKKTDAFGEWAWGESLSGPLCPIELMKIWNDRHGELLLLCGCDTLYESLEKMVQLWKEHKRKK